MSRLFLFISALLAIFLSSEAVYLLTNNSSELNYFLLERAKHYAVAGKFSRSFKYLGWIGKFKSVNLKPTPTNPKFQQEYLNYISSINPQAIIQSKDNRISEVFYYLGLIAFWNKETILTPMFFQIAVSIQPELSFYHVEFANYYLSAGDKQSADKAISNCLKLKDPRTHCQEYQENRLKSNISEKVGFLQQAVEGFYK